MALAIGFVGVLAEENTYEIGMITDIGTIDDKSFNQGTWEGIKNFAEANGKTYNYFQPNGQSTEIYLEYIQQAVEAGAKIVLTPGFLFEEPVYIAQDMYPEVHFVLIDGNPHNADYSEFRTEKNAVGITYAEEESGFLAGYAAVKEGYTKLGFMGGMAVPAVIRFGYGYIQGAEFAAKELGITGLECRYHYTGGFSATPEAQTMAASWFADGIEVIFACGGAVGNSVMAAAEASKKGKVIGVDVDQSSESETVITSAMKGLAASVEQVLDAYYKGEFPGGEALVFDAALDGVQLPMETSKFEKFTQEDYDAIYKQLVDKAFKIQKDSDVTSAAELASDIISVTVIE
ncbi:MAG: BMP family ABC transporter substrate-binding protein [Eubacteriales bacterium]|nr:BMP family ABC transporter substrate-binding protein [Eubacteriales bacterium]